MLKQRYAKKIKSTIKHNGTLYTLNSISPGLDRGIVTNQKTGESSFAVLLKNEKNQWEIISLDKEKQND